MKLIDKDAVLAIIDRLFDKHSSKHDIDEAGVVLLQLRENVESLEVKELDLQSEIDRVWDNTSDNFPEDGWKEFEDIAKHFFELGLKVSNSSNIVHIVDEESGNIYEVEVTNN